jgi:acetyltransferase, GNAT family
MNNLIIRKYVIDDFNEVIKLLKDNFNISDNIKSIDDNLNSFGMVASFNKKIVGYIRIDKLNNPFKNNYYYFLSYVCVDSNYQNIGIATKMLEFIFNMAKDNNINYIELTSRSSREVANHLYLKTGFVIRDTNVFRKEI